MFDNVDLTEHSVIHAALKAAARLVFEENNGNLNSIQDIEDTISNSYSLLLIKRVSHTRIETIGIVKCLVDILGIQL